MAILSSILALMAARPPVRLSVVPAGAKNMIFYFHIVLTTALSQIPITGKAGGLASRLEAPKGIYRAQGVQTHVLCVCLPWV